nr:MAG TPA: hypothetical protein [Caudoviricetes sp.]
MRNMAPTLSLRDMVGVVLFIFVSLTTFWTRLRLVFPPLSSFFSLRPNKTLFERFILLTYTPHDLIILL